MSNLDDAVERMREFVAAVEAVNSKSQLTYGDVVYGLNDHELRRSDIRTVLDALETCRATLDHLSHVDELLIEAQTRRAESAEAELDAMRVGVGQGSGVEEKTARAIKRARGNAIPWGVIKP